MTTFLLTSTKMKYVRWVNGKAKSCTISDMRKYLPKTTPLKRFKQHQTIHVRNRMTANDSYELAERPARTIEDVRTTYRLNSGQVREFKPAFMPWEILEAGAFAGRMINDCMDEFPREYFEPALKADKLRPSGRDPSVNRFGVDCGTSLEYWRSKGWIRRDPRGWFQWYCRYCLGRRDAQEDLHQMKRWSAMARHARNTSPKGQQTLLHWAWPI